MSVRWTGPEVIKLKALYPTASWEEILAALPRHDKPAVMSYARALKLSRRSVPNSHAESRHPLVKILRDRRLALGRSLFKVAGDADCDRLTLTRCENSRGDRLPSGTLLWRWAAALGFELALIPAGTKERAAPRVDERSNDRGTSPSS